MEGSGWIDSYVPGQIASVFDPGIQPLSALVPHPDPDPARTAKLRRSMQDAADGVSNPQLLTARMNAATTRDFRTGTKQPLAAMSGFQFLACEKASARDPYGAVQYCQYRTKVPPGALDLGFGLAANGQLASTDGQLE